MRKLCACLCFVGAVALVPACGSGGGGKSGSECDAGEKLAEVNGTEGCYAECDNGACDPGFTCNSGLCIEDSSNGGTNGSPNGNTNGSPNGNTNGSPNGNTNNNNNNPIDPALAEKCEEYAELIFGCINDNCTLEGDLATTLEMEEDTFLNGDGTAQNPGCAQEASDNPMFATQLTDFVAENTCDTLSGLRCGQLGLTDECGCSTPTNLGAACTMDDECDGGDLIGGCATEEDSELPGGYCLAQPCPTSQQMPDGYAYQSPACGEGNICRVFVDPMSMDRFGLCFAGCEGGCDREGYACQLASIIQNEEMELEVVRYCTEACAANEDCANDDSARCNTDTGSCEFECDGEAGPNGEPSLADICASNGGTCTMDADLGKEYCVF
jgi:hypothetical protein